MTPKTEERIDERLGQLLGVERRLEGRLKQADEQALALVATAKRAAEQTNSHERAELEKTSAREEREDLEAHTAALKQIDEESARAVAALEAVPELRVDELARRVVGWLLEEGGR